MSPPAHFQQSGNFSALSVLSAVKILLNMVVLVMGVVGSGKTTVGSLLAQQLGWEFVDGDTFHSPANVAKMRRGEPLTDADRGPWLQSIHEAIVGWVAQKKSVVLACSALKRSYREQLSVAGEPAYVYL